MSGAGVEDGWDDTLFHVRRSIRYHMKRERFFGWWYRAGGFLTTISGTVAAGALLNRPGNPDLAFGLSTLIVVIQFGDLYYQPAERARVHDSLRRRFCLLESELVKVPVDARTEEALRLIKAERSVIERDEPPTMEILDDICHNEQCEADGYIADPSDPNCPYAKVAGWKVKALRLMQVA